MLKSMNKDLWYPWQAVLVTFGIVIPVWEMQYRNFRRNIQTRKDYCKYMRSGDATIEIIAIMKFIKFIKYFLYKPVLIYGS
jgi:hypothetical protein